MTKKKFTCDGKINHCFRSDVIIFLKEAHIEALVVWAGVIEN